MIKFLVFISLFGSISSINSQIDGIVLSLNQRILPIHLENSPLSLSTFSIGLKIRQYAINSNIEFIGLNSYSNFFHYSRSHLNLGLGASARIFKEEKFFSPVVKIDFSTEIYPLGNKVFPYFVYDPDNNVVATFNRTYRNTIMSTIQTLADFKVSNFNFQIGFGFCYYVWNYSIDYVTHSKKIESSNYGLLGSVAINYTIPLK
jgi:hypothetical protein